MMPHKLACCLWIRRRGIRVQRCAGGLVPHTMIEPRLPSLRWAETGPAQCLSGLRACASAKTHLKLLKHTYTLHSHLHNANMFACITTRGWVFDGRYWYLKQELLDSVTYYSIFLNRDLMHAVLLSLSPFLVHHLYIL